MRAAIADESDELLGLAYGWPGPERIPDEAGFYGGVVSALGRQLVDEILSDHPLEVVQAMVDPSVQRRRIARSLLQTLLSGIDRAWLVTIPGSPAASLYRSMGWRAVEPSLSLWGRQIEVWVMGA